VEVVVQGYQVQTQTYQVEMVEMVEHPAAEVEVVVQVQIQEQVEMGVQVEEVRCGFILGNKIFIKIKLWQIF
jgi:hypothetical protein